MTLAIDIIINSTRSSSHFLALTSTVTFVFSLSSNSKASKVLGVRGNKDLIAGKLDFYKSVIKADVMWDSNSKCFEEV